MAVNPEALALISQAVAQKAEVAAVEIISKKLALAVLNPNTSLVQEVVKNLESQGYKISIIVVSLSSLKHAWSFYQFIFEKAKEITGKIEIEEKTLVELKKTLVSLADIKNSILALDAKTGQTSQVLEIILAGALANRASDVHIEPMEKVVKLRLRVDGLLHDVFNELKRNVYNYLLSRIKLLSGLKLNVRDEAQDGRFSISLAEKEIEIRTSVIPSEFGETVVLRILDPDTINLSLTDLGFRKDDLEITEKELAKPNGMILNTGPTGSGKTTTLYTFLRHAQNPEVKIITIEDPIEYHLDGIEQTQVDPDAGYTFSSGLRSILRQDPDMILVGEIRDLETAEIAMHAALTGHLVFSTLHTNEASGAIPRLVDLGVKLSVIAPATNLIIAQRLVRRLCEKCKTPVKIDKELQENIKKFLEKIPQRVDKKDFEEIKMFEAKGCDKCGSTGYRGRIGVFELIQIDEEFERLLIKELPEAEIRDFAFKKGLVTMQQDGVLKAISGMTTIKEVEKATGPIEW